jgi:hypothetical protein
MSQQKPCAICTDCGHVSYSLNLINGPCGRSVGGKRCRGVNVSRLNTDDWAECDECAGSGSANGSRCVRCEGAGWVDVRAR